MKTLLFSILFSTFSFAEISIMISHNNTLTKVSRQQIVNIFLKKTSSINGIKVTPIDSSNRKLYREFYRKVIKKTPKQIHAYWVKEIFSGNKKPPKKLSSKALKNALRHNKKIIGYTKGSLGGKLILTIR